MGRCGINRGWDSWPLQGQKPTKSRPWVEIQLARQSSLLLANCAGYRVQCRNRRFTSRRASDVKICPNYHQSAVKSRLTIQAESSGVNFAGRLHGGRLARRGRSRRENCRCQASDSQAKSPFLQIERGRLLAALGQSKALKKQELTSFHGLRKMVDSTVVSGNTQPSVAQGCIGPAFRATMWVIVAEEMEN
jgi:hypothetical protein